MDEVLSWLLDSDPALRYQTRRDLLGEKGPALEALRASVAGGPWAAELLRRRGPDGHWGLGPYVPKWTCTHYVLFELAQLGVAPDDPRCRDSCLRLLAEPAGADGGINYAKTVKYSDVCVNGAILFMASYFGIEGAAVRSVLDFLLQARMPDRGWNCEYLRDARHSSMHTTVAALEGLGAYLSSGAAYRRDEAREAALCAVEFLLQHRLFKSDRTGEVVKDEFLKFNFPARWKYDVLRGLDCLRAIGAPLDPRMGDALDLVESSAGPDGRWKSRAQAGRTYFVAEPAGRPGRWNTLRALRVLLAYGRRDGFA